MVFHCAHRLYRPCYAPGLEVDDLVGMGYEGLVRAAGRFDESRGVKWTTFAWHNIRSCIRHGVRDTCHLIRTPHHADVAPYTCISFDEPSLETLPDTRSERELESVHNRWTHDQVRRELVTLPPRQQQVIAYVYGFHDGRERSISEASRDIGISAQAACLYHRLAIEKLRCKLQ